VNFRDVNYNVNLYCAIILCSDDISYHSLFIMIYLIYLFFCLICKVKLNYVKINLDFKYS